MKRYAITNIRWVRTGPRSGWRRRRRWQMRTWEIGKADDLMVATGLLVNAPMRWDEAVFLYDHAHPSTAIGNGVCIAERTGQDW